MTIRAFSQGLVFTSLGLSHSFSPVCSVCPYDKETDNLKSQIHILLV